MLTVGFDLDMTLVDSADSIVESLMAVVVERGHEVDEQQIRDTIGMPFPLVLPTLIPEADPDELLAAYRAHYRVHGVPKTKPLPGAHDAVAAIREVGARVVVVTAKQGITAVGALAAAGFEIPEADVVAEVFAEEKGHALKGFGAQVYVGDHPGDMTGAKVASAVAVGVPTGPTSAEDLVAAGADVLLPEGLVQFRDWFTGWLSSR
ncbi:MAG: HAD family hydrolase [Candidatus Nanopelagicales bacterium]